MDMTFNQTGFNHTGYNTSHPHHPHHLHLGSLVDQSISKLAPFSAIILTVCTVIVFAFRFYFFEGFLLPRLYGQRYFVLNDSDRRSFVNHHVAGSIKALCVIVGAYPTLCLAFGKGNPHTPFAGSRYVTIGDVMVVCSQIFTVMYIFELFYRQKISYISAAHHVGAILIAQSAVAISLNFDHEVDAVYEFVLCLLWGAFDCVAELWPHLSMILYRARPDNHLLLENVMLATSALEILGTTSETALIMWLFGSLWSRWTLPFKIATPMLHFLFSCAQLWGAYVFWQLSKSQRRKWEKKELQESGKEPGETC